MWFGKRRKEGSSDEYKDEGTLQYGDERERRSEYSDGASRTSKISAPRTATLGSMFGLGRKSSARSITSDAPNDLVIILAFRLLFFFRCIFTIDFFFVFREMAGNNEDL